jgi:PhnB protein
MNMSIQVYLYFNGNCRDALEFYEKAFETEKPKIMLYGEAPASGFPMTDDLKKLVLNASITIKGSEIMMSDVPPGKPFTNGDNFSLTVMSDDKNDIRTMFDRIKDGGEVQMELQETFWSKLYGSATDKFGISWQLNYCGT